MKSKVLSRPGQASPDAGFHRENQAGISAGDPEKIDNGQDPLPVIVGIFIQKYAQRGPRLMWGLMWGHLDRYAAPRGCCRRLMWADVAEVAEVPASPDRHPAWLSQKSEQGLIDGLTEYLCL